MQFSKKTCILKIVEYQRAKVMLKSFKNSPIIFWAHFILLFTFLFNSRLYSQSKRQQLEEVASSRKRRKWAILGIGAAALLAFTYWQREWLKQYFGDEKNDEASLEESKNESAELPTNPFDFSFIPEISEQELKVTPDLENPTPPIEEGEMAQRLTSEEITLMLSGEVKSPRQQDGSTCGAYALANVLTASGYSLGDQPLDPKKSFHDNAKMNADLIIKLLDEQNQKNLIQAKNEQVSQKKALTELAKFINSLKKENIEILTEEELQKSVEEIQDFLKKPEIKDLNPLRNTETKTAYEAMSKDDERLKFLLQGLQKNAKNCIDHLENKEKTIKQLEKDVKRENLPSEDVYRKILKNHNPDLYEACPVLQFTKEALQETVQLGSKKIPNGFFGLIGMASSQGMDIPETLKNGEIDILSAYQTETTAAYKAVVSDPKCIGDIFKDSEYKKAFKESLQVLKLKKRYPDFAKELEKQKQPVFSIEEMQTLLNNYYEVKILDKDNQKSKDFFKKESDAYKNADSKEAKKEIVSRVAKEIAKEACYKVLNLQTNIEAGRKFASISEDVNENLLQEVERLKQEKVGAFMLQTPGHFTSILIKPDHSIVWLDSNTDSGVKNMDASVEKNLRDYFEL